MAAVTAQWDVDLLNLSHVRDMLEESQDAMRGQHMTQLNEHSGQAHATSDWTLRTELQAATTEFSPSETREVANLTNLAQVKGDLDTEVWKGPRSSSTEPSRRKRTSPPPPPGPPGLPTVRGYTTPQRPTGGNPNGSPESDPGTMTKETGEVLKFPKDLNKHRSKLIPLKIGKNYLSMNPAKLNQELKEWLHRTGMILGTWCDEAPHWWEAQTNIARKKHKEWLQTVLRVELADPSTNILPRFIIERARKLGHNTTESLLFLTFRELQPSEDLNKMVTTDELEDPPANLPPTYSGQTSWFETGLTSLWLPNLWTPSQMPESASLWSQQSFNLVFDQGDALLLHSLHNKAALRAAHSRNRTRETRLEERVNNPQATNYVSSNAATPKGKGKDKNTHKGKGKEEPSGKGQPEGGGKDSKGKGGKDGKKGTTYCAEYYTDAGCPNGDA
eukprot:6460505-Amphidinium_carterae.1